MIKFIDVERLDSDECSGLLQGNVFIMPKIDGSNGQVYLNEKGELECASRKNVLTPESTNQGFYTYVMDNKDQFLNYFSKYKNRILYGEWLVPHTLKDYQDWTWRKFYIFDVFNSYSCLFLEYNKYSVELTEFGLNCVPLLGYLYNPTEDDVRKYVDTNKFLMKDGFIGEGIVIKNYGFHNKYGRVVWGKIVRKQFQEQMKIEHPQPEKLSVEKKIAQEYIVQARLEKIKAKLIVEKGGWNSKMIPEYLGRVWFELITEEIWHILKDYKNPVINFKELNQCIIYQTKVLDKETFS